MRTIVVSRSGGPDVLERRDIEPPEPGADDVLVEALVAGVNFADVMVREGRYHLTPELPFIPGMEVAGTVLAVGSSVEAFREGDRVTAFTGLGGYAERAVAPSRLTWRVPDGVDLDQAAAVPVVGVTAYNLLTLAGGLRPGETVLVHSAAGGVGTTVVQLARFLGAARIIGTVGSEAKVGFAREAGCDEVIVRGSEPLVQRVRDITDGAGVDLALDSIAGPQFAPTVDCVADSGRVVVFGMGAGVPGSVTTDVLHPRNRSVVGYSTGSLARREPDRLRPAGDAVLRLFAERRIRVMIGRTYPLEDARRAHRDIEGGLSTGKLLLRTGLEPERATEVGPTSERGT